MVLRLLKYYNTKKYPYRDIKTGAILPLPICYLNDICIAHVNFLTPKQKPIANNCAVLKIMKGLITIS